MTSFTGNAMHASVGIAVSVIAGKKYIFWTLDNAADFIKRLQNERNFRLPPLVFEALTLLGYYAASICVLLQTFRDSLSVSFTWFKHLWMVMTLKMRWMGLDCFALEYWTDRLYRKVCKQLPTSPHNIAKERKVGFTIFERYFFHYCKIFKWKSTDNVFL
jgi:hypothetical protein